MQDFKLPYRILAVDPATGLSGWVLLILESIYPLRIRIEAYGTFSGDKLIKDRKDMSQIFSRQFCIVDALFYNYSLLIEELKPDEIVVESAFGHNHLSAFIAISLAIDALRRASHTLLNKDVVTIPPTVSKMAFTGSGSADKDAMRKAYYANDWIIKPDVEDMSEHVIDAVAHGAGAVKVHITKEVTQVHAKDRKRAKLEKAKRKKEKQIT